ncbi:eukaryotic translation initiation factor 4 gamma 3, partial [Cherax quadricarinatus]|uniref:eukaryotic translation initiation factor 4 gamma 3 n=1 Tax=Cherax quadricarinatus TaxID=27406 RepID=UPI002379B87B
MENQRPMEGKCPHKKYSTRPIHRSDGHRSLGRKKKDCYGKRGKGISREEPTPVCDSTDTPSQTQPPRLPSPPQEATAPPSSPSPPPSVAPQPVNKFPAQVPSSKEKKEKEKTPEPVHFKPQLPPQKPASVPPSKETSPQPTPSPTLSEESKSEHSSKERELNSVECEVNNVHEDKEEEKKDDGPQLKYTYKEDQWSPVNPEGKRQYDRRFLLELQNNPLSLKKPESLPNLEVVRDGPGRHKTYDPRVPMPHGGGGPDFTPDYVKSTLGNKQPRMVTRNSQQRCQTGGGPVNRG